MPPVRISRPAPSEHPAEFADYFASIEGDDVRPTLLSQPEEMQRLLAPLPEDRGLHRYAPGKWTIKGVVGHVCDLERILTYRTLRFARGDETPLATFDDDRYVSVADFDSRPLRDLLREFASIRAATSTLFDSFDEAALGRFGVARGFRVGVRALAWLIAGHVRHHLTLLRERYRVA